MEQKLQDQEIDHVDSRTLSLPFLQGIGRLGISGAGAFIEKTDTPDTHATHSLLADNGRSSAAEDVSAAKSLKAAGAAAGAAGTKAKKKAADVVAENNEEVVKKKPQRWMLPQLMQVDLRAITREAVLQLLATEATTQVG